ncbi:MAG TPA: Rrf2 family transcriptional regulator [Pyrinomonadaceae bacterium]|nr:Rrf2 family transcriptional regulator [Pyrinomonadaceae bacterium]
MIVTVMAINSQFAKAVHILTLLSVLPDRKLSSDDIACSVNTNPVVIRRLLGQLSSAGFVESRSGAAGGTRLARPPAEISLDQVYAAVNCGEVFAIHEGNPSKNCFVSENIESVLCELREDLDRTVTERLAGHTLETLLKRIGERTAGGH